MKTKTLSIFLILLFISKASFSQRQADNWFFGHNAGVSFASGSPISIPNGQTYVDEGVASMSDYNGKLMFYTEGTNVWDSSHTLMPNGTGLLGNSSSTQSAMIIPLPGNPNLFYIFTTGVGFGDLNYSIVDMTLQSGLGDVTVKNSLIQTLVTEKLCGVKNQNGTDYWIIVHGTNNTFYAFSFSATGVNLVPVTSNNGLSSAGGGIGYLKASPQGDKLAAAYWDSGNLFEIYDFDNSTGIVSNALTLPFHAAGSGAYGVEFSLSGRYLYTSWITPGEIRQYDLQAGSNAAILSSEVLIGTATNAFNGALQMGPDNKIYLVQAFVSYLGVINDPDQQGLGCNYIDVGLALASGEGTLGLPNFSYDLVGSVFQFEGICFGDSTYFNYTSNAGIGGVYWDFGDTASGINNDSYQYNPVHLFSDTGSFHVQLIKYYVNGNIDTVFQEIMIRPVPVVFLGNDSTLCNGDTILLNPGNYQNYLWQDASTQNTYTVTASGNYSVKISDGYCEASDTVTISFNTCASPGVSLSSSDTTFCDKKCIDFTDLSTNSPTSWYWSFPGADSTSSNLQNPINICYNAYGSFDVTLIACNAAGCDTLILPGFINEYPAPAVPVININGFVLTSSPAFSYQWYQVPSAIPGATGQSYTITQPGTYYVVITDSLGCISTSAFITGVGIAEQVSLHSLQLLPLNNHSWLCSIPHISDKIVSYKIVDILGRTIDQTRPQKIDGAFSKEINLENRSAGLYFVEIKVGDQVRVIKINN